MNNVNAIYNTNPAFGGQHFGGTVNQNGLDLSQFQQQRLADGHAHSQSPNIQHTPFQVPQVVPAKRSRPGEDHVSASQHIGPGAHNRSRSQTPQQQPYPTYSGQPPNSQYPTPTSMQHMQQTMSPSPASLNQPFRPPGMGPYAQIQQMNRMGTPQDRTGIPPNAAQQAFMRQNPQAGGAGSPQMGGQTHGASPQANMNSMQMQEAMRRRYQSQLAQSQQQMQGHTPQPSQPGQPGGMGDQHRPSWAGSTNGQTPTRPGMPQPSDHMSAIDKAQEQAFIKSLTNFHAQRQRHLNPDPRVCGQPVTYFKLFRKYAEFNPGANPQAWAALAAGLGMNPSQDPSIIKELRSIFEQDLQAFYFLYFKAMRDKKMKTNLGQPNGGPPPMTMQGSPQQMNDRSIQPPLPPAFSSQQPQPVTNQTQSPRPQDLPGPSDALNRSTVQERRSASDAHSAGVNGHRKSGSLFSQIGTPDQVRSESSVRPQSGNVITTVQPSPPRAHRFDLDGSSSSALYFQDAEYIPGRHQVSSHGGIEVEALDYVGGRLNDLKTYPRYEELGLVDLHVLNMCLQSGFEAEINYALDQLGALSQRPLVLSKCEELLDSLIECGEEQIIILLDSKPSTSESISIPCFDQIAEVGLQEVEGIQSRPRYGESDYKSEHAIDRLLAVTTILRNLSFPAHEAPGHDREFDSNPKMLTSPTVKSFVGNVMKILAAGESAFHTARNAQDIMKDLVTFCSNTADYMELSSEDEARLFLNFLVSFTPSTPTTSSSKSLTFSSFDPAQHQYLPCAVDSLAKFLARDDPNRMYYRSIFGTEATSSSRRSADMLITRSFALAIAPIPDGSGGAFSTNAATLLANRRKPLLSQGMLAADILSTLIPGSSHVSLPEDSHKASLERSWLESADAWAPRLMRLIVAMAMSDGQGSLQRDPMTQAVIDDSSRGFVSITQRALSMLRRLVERSDKWDAENNAHRGKSASLALFGAVPLDALLFSAISLPRFDGETMKSLAAFANLARSG